MFGIGFPEMIIILIVALVVVGPDKLPDLARSLAKGVNELRGAMNQIKESLNEETKVISSVKEDLRKTAGQMKDDLLKDNIGGPRRMPSEDTLIEMEADLAEAAGPRPWEQDETAISPQETTKEAVVDSAAPAEEENVAPAEERVMGKNPAAPAV
jgi:sec-independent protein translocase protein TatB